MLKEDFVIQSQVRRILVRSNVDYTKFDFGTVRGVVYFRGGFKLVGTSSDGDDLTNQNIRAMELPVKILISLEKKVRNLPGVVDVVFQFVNWKKDVGRWIPVAVGKKKEESRCEEENDSALQEDSAGD